MWKRFLLVALLLILAVVAAAFWYRGGSPERGAETRNAESGITVGKLAPLIILRDLDGQSVEVNRTGQITVLNFWATWCPPCREEMPELDAFARSLPPKVAFYAVNIQEPAAKILDYIRQNRYTMPVFADSDGSVSTAYRVNAIPTTLIIDRNGIIQFRKTGGVTKAELLSIIKGLQER